MKTNTQWHQKNRLGKSPSVKERVMWHLGHSKHCSCRPMPANIEAEIKKWGLGWFVKKIARDNS